MGDVLRKRIKQEKFEGPLQEAVLNLLVAAGHVRDRVDRLCGRYGITNGQYNVLRILRGGQPDGYPRNEISRRMLERAPDVTRLIDRLEERGLVERARSDRDRRLSVTRITPTGLGLLEEMQPGMDEFYTYVAHRLSTDDAVELSRICEGMYGEEE